jgi:hypothetical protein
VGQEKIDGSVTTKEAFARPKYVVIIAGSRREERGEAKKQSLSDGHSQHGFLPRPLLKKARQF